MDTVTHGVVGYLLARSGLDQRAGAAARAACVVGAVIPDADYVLYQWGTETYLRHHRGWTHCLPGGVLLALCVAAGAWRFGGRPSFRPLAVAALAGYASHAFLDLVTSYGTMLCVPLSWHRFALDWVFIVDLTLSAIVVAGMVLTLVRPATARAAARASLVVLCAYLALAAGCHERAEARLRALVGNPSPPPSDLDVIPQVAGPLRWGGFAALPQDIVRYDILLGSDEVPVTRHARESPADDPLIRATDGLEVVRMYHWFARFPICRRRRDAQGEFVEYFDLRYDQFPGLRPFVLRVRFDAHGKVASHEIRHDAW